MRKLVTKFAAAFAIAASAICVSAHAETVKFGLPSKGFLHMAVYLADEMGYLKDEGVDVSVVDPTSAMRAHERGADIVAFAAEMNQYGSNVVVRKSTGWTATRKQRSRSYVPSREPLN